MAWYRLLARKTAFFLPEKVLRLTLALLAAFAAQFVLTLLLGRHILLGFPLLFNILLVLVPCACALGLSMRHSQGKKGLLSVLLWCLWWPMFPNGPYMLTDLIHITSYDFSFGADAAPSRAAWFGLVYVASIVLVGLLFGALSLYLPHQFIRARHGVQWGWAFSGFASLLAGIGIFIGRFMRFNSWDLLRKPLQLFAQLSGRLSLHSVWLCLLFAAATFCGYALFYLCFSSPGGGLATKAD